MTFAQPFEGYEILERVGAGAMGTVFKARQKRLNRIVALKVLRPSLARNTHYVDRLRREARIVAQLNHPNIVAGYDLGEEAGYHFFVMEFVQGRSLRELLVEWGSFPPELVLDFAIQVTSALDHAWQKGVIHRDIKPANILIDDQNRVKLSDMGLAKGPSDLTLTRDGATVGTPQYISPEQARDPQSADVRSDLYSLGATMFHMATGLPPFQAETLAQVLTKVLHDPAPSPRQVNPALSEGLDLVIRKLLAKEPGLRYQTPAELLADLERVQRQERPRVDEAALDETSSRPRVRRVWYLASAATVLLAAVALWLGSGEPAPRAADLLERRLRAELDRADGYARRFEVLAAAEAEQPTAELRDVVRGFRGGVETTFLAALDRHLDGYRSDALQSGQLDQWLHSPAGWRDAAALRTEFLLRRMEQQLRVELAALPDGLVSEVNRRFAQFERDVIGRIGERNRELLAALRDHHLREVPHAWQPLLQARDFRNAELALREAVREFFGRDGRPQRADLGGTVEAQVAAIDDATLEKGLATIAAEEQKVVAAFELELGRALDALRRALGGDPVAVDRELDRVAAELRRDYPRSQFRPEADPWPAADARLRALERDVELELAGAERSALQQSLRIVCRGLVFDGQPGRGADWLRRQELRSAEAQAERDAFASWFEDAQLAYDRLLAVADEPTEARYAHGRGSIALRTVGVDGAPALAPVRNGVPMPAPFELRWSSMFGPWREAIGRSEPAVPAERLARGIAVWSFVGGESFSGFRTVPREQIDVAQRLERLIAGQRPDEPVEATIRAAYAVLDEALQEADPAKLEAALAQIPELPPHEPRQGQQDLVQAAQRQLVALRGRADRRKTIEAELPPGTELAVAPDGTVSLRYALQDERIELPSGWTRAHDGLRAEPVPSAAAGSPAQPLLLPDGLGAAAQVTVSLRLRLPPSPNQPVLHLFELHGAVFVLGMLRDGRPISHLVTPATADRADLLKRALQPALVAAERALPVFVPGALHTLRLEVARQRDRLRGRLWIDGQELPVGPAIDAGSRMFAGLRVQPLQELELERVELQSGER